jgi:hypothetical protein
MSKNNPFILYLLPVFLLIIFSFGCMSNTNTETFDIKKHLKKYDTTKAKMATKRTELSQAYTNSSPANKKKVIKQAHDYLLNNLTSELFPFWYGTEWDFNGITQTPRQGQIACGYFVTTTLKHSGFEVERVRLAQQAASYIIKTVCLKSSIKTICCNKFNSMLSHFEAQPVGLYIIGLDNHVGYIHKSKDELYFIHSSVVGRKCVREKAKNSKVLKRSNLYMIGNLLDNDAIVVSWLKGQKIVSVLP